LTSCPPANANYRHADLGVGGRLHRIQWITTGDGTGTYPI
jgi:hypothetical protein